MRVPQVNDRVKEAPAHALRAMFASIGQFLLFTDRLRNRSDADKATVPTQSSAPAKEQPEDTVVVEETTVVEETEEKTVVAEAETVAAEAAAKAEAAAAETAPAAETASAEAAAPTAAAAAETAPAADTAPAETAAPTAAAPTAAAPTAAAAAGTESGSATALPLPNYDELTIPSLRARLRNLTVEQLNEVIGYEQAHANRADVIAMFERRIAKLAEG